MAKGGGQGGGQGGALASTKFDEKLEKELSVSVPRPLSPGKPFLQQLCGTLGVLWGADRVIRTFQFGGRIIAGSPEVSRAQSKIVMRVCV
jgi:hypothetical protein